ncbi:MAG TPA: cytochrome c [Candidatus Binatia bacterium]|jgi:mono/diheme cytochrome c family protein|nr:cytochrome c [Candidatus Binatia bacterium]
MITSTCTQPWIRKKELAEIVAATLLWVLPAVGLAQEEVVLKNGQREYQAYCATCHGTQGKGDGPMSTILIVVPADLTQIRKKNSGEFPFWRVYKIIDGRDMVRGHGARGMPVWGAYFLSEEGGGYLDEDRVIGRVLGLVYYLQSIQEK